MIKASGIIIYKTVTDLHDFKFLLLQASKSPYHWTPPKGRLDPGEDNIQAAFRETLEESGITRDAIELDKEFKETLHYRAHGEDKECIYFLGKLLNNSVNVKLSDEHQDFAWVDIKDIPEYCNKDSLRTMFLNAHTHLKGVK